MATITFTWAPGGTLTNVYAAKLSDPTGAFGARRTDTSAVVVADGTAMSNPSTGTYTYDLGDITVRHEAWVEIVEDGDEPDVSLWRQLFIDADGSAGAESSLSLNRTQLRIEVANYLGLNTDSTTWGTKNTDRVNRITANGERMFYRPTVLPGENSIHTWTFLEQVGEFELEDGTSDYTLTAGFNGFVDPTLRYIAAGNEWHEVKYVPVTKILHWRQEDTPLSVDTAPTHYSIAPAASDQSTGQRYTLMVHPEPNDDYTLTGLYRVNPSAISASDPYPMGGQPHAETLRAAVLAAAEMDRYSSRGDLYARFLEQLRDSIMLDRKVSTPKCFGYNADRSGGRRDLPWIVHAGDVVTLNGQLPD